MEFIKIAVRLREPKGYPAVLATLVDVAGSSYRRVGARMLFTRTGERLGSVSGGCLETDLAARAAALLECGSDYDLAIYDTTSENDLLWGVGTGCHGIVRIFLEKLHCAPPWVDVIASLPEHRQRVGIACCWRPAQTSGAKRGTQLQHRPLTGCDGILSLSLSPPLHLIIFGAGDDSHALVTFAQALDWQVSVVDPRPGWATASRFPTANNTLQRPCETAAQAFDWDDLTIAVIMTHHYRFDLPLLRCLVPLRLTFLGLLGPAARGQRLWRDAGLTGSPSTDLSWHNPVGLDLGGDGPAAVALSIVAEIQAALHSRNGQRLRDRQRPIHDE